MKVSVTFTWCLSNCDIISNELTDVQVKKGSATNQAEIDYHYVLAKVAVRGITRGNPVSYDRIKHIYGDRGKKLDHLAETKLSRKSR